MPELPEVETVVNTLKNMIINKKIVKVDVYWDNIVDKISVDEFKEKIVNQHIVDIERKGKIILYILDDYVMLSHLRMEGKYYVDSEFTKDKHSHVIIYFDDNTFLRYHDTRKFGKISLISKSKINEHPYIQKVGPEPFTIDSEYLYDRLKTKRIEIKACLLDQSIMSGLGNIYVDEVLFLSKINPSTPSNTISKAQVKFIIDNSIKVLNKAISLGGTTIRSYTSSLGVSGRFQNELNVHTKVGLPCPICKTIIIKTKVKQRGTYLCPKCQK